MSLQVHLLGHQLPELTMVAKSCKTSCSRLTLRFLMGEMRLPKRNCTKDPKPLFSLPKKRLCKSFQPSKFTEGLKFPNLKLLPLLFPTPSNMSAGLRVMISEDNLASTTIRLFLLTVKTMIKSAFCIRDQRPWETTRELLSHKRFSKILSNNPLIQS